MNNTCLLSKPLTFVVIYYVPKDNTVLFVLHSFFNQMILRNKGGRNSVESKKNKLCKIMKVPDKIVHRLKIFWYKVTKLNINAKLWGNIFKFIFLLKYN